MADSSDLLRRLDCESEFGQQTARFWQQGIWAASDWRALPQSLRQKLRKRFARKVVGPFDVIFEKMNFRLYPAENYCDRVIFGRKDLPERAEHEALVPLLKSGMVFVDIGANIGSYSVFVGTRLSGEATLLAFEPHPRTHAKLLFNLQANGLPIDNVINCGVGPRHETLKLWSDGGSNIGHTSMLKAGTAHPKVSVDVPVAPLADILSEQKITTIDILKIDIEGFEDRALAPFFDMADPSLWPHHVLIETAHQHLWERNVVAMMEERGYRAEFTTAENVLLSRG